MAVRFTSDDDFVVHSFAGDDPIRCRDYVRERLGLPGWQPGDGRNRSVPSYRIREWDEQQADEGKRPMTAEELERIAYAVRIWDEGQDPRGTLAERYLQEHRKLDLGAEIAGSVLRFHPECPWRDENFGPVRVPALIAAFRSIDDDAVMAVQRIALNPDGTKIGRRMTGLIRRSAIKLAAPRNGELVIAEGVETALAAMKLEIGPAWALGSAGQFNFFPVVPSVRHLILSEEADETSRHSVKLCARRWRRAGRKTSIVSSEFGSDLNDAVIELAKASAQ